MVAMGADSRWWLDEGPKNRAQRVYDTATAIWRSQHVLRDQIALNARSYGDLHMTGLTPGHYQKRQGAGAKAVRLSMNMTKSVADTFVAMLTKDQPKVSCLTSDQDWDAQQRAKKREAFLDGCLYETNLRSLATEIAYDMVKASIGIVYFYEDASSKMPMKVERVLPGELLVDDLDATYRDMRSLHRIKWIDKHVLATQWPEFADEIMQAKVGAFDDSGPSNTSLNQAVELLPVISSWHLPTPTPPKKKSEDTPADVPDEDDPIKAAGDGRYSITVGSEVTLLDEEWTDDGFPFEFLYKQKPATGIWGCSLVEELSSQQRELNILLAKIQRSLHLLGAGHWLIPNGSKINTNHMDNQIGSMIGFSGSPPQFIAVQTVNQETYAQIDRIKAGMYETSGISPQLAQGQKPAGLDSGEAQRVHADIAAARFEPCYLEYQDFFVRCAKQFIKLASRIHARTGELKVRAEVHGQMAMVDFEDVKDAADSDVLKLYPTNELPDDPEGRLAFVQELINSGMLPDKQAGMRLLNFPDLASATDLQDASYNMAMWSIAAIRNNGEFHAPLSLMNLGEARLLAVESYLDGVRKGCPEVRLNMLLRWISQIDDLTKAAQPPPPPGPSTGPSAPPGPPPPQPMPQAA